MKKYPLLIAYYLLPILGVLAQNTKPPLVADFGTDPFKKRTIQLPNFNKAIPMREAQKKALALHYLKLHENFSYNAVKTIGIDPHAPPVTLFVYFETVDTLYHFTTLISTNASVLKNELMVMIPGRYWLRTNDLACGEVYFWDVAFLEHYIMYETKKFKMDCD